jgi:hypothetical protein
VVRDFCARTLYLPTQLSTTTKVTPILLHAEQQTETETEAGFLSSTEGQFGFQDTQNRQHANGQTDSSYQSVVGGRWPAACSLRLR